MVAEAHGESSVGKRLADGALLPTQHSERLLKGEQLCFAGMAPARRLAPKHVLQSVTVMGGLSGIR